VLLISGNLDGNTVYSSSSGLCSGVNCHQRTTLIAGSIVGGGTALVLLLICTLLCCRRYKGRPSQANLSFINSTNHTNNRQNTYDITLFKSGIWLSRHLQFGMWHGFHRFTLSFDPQSSKVTGSGSDNIGVFTIDGCYSNRTSRIGLTKSYQLGTGNRSQNFGHQVLIQLVWNSETRQFEGKWYVQTKKYRAEDKFELKFSNQQQLSPYEKV
jgi:hypothetical protein